MKLSLVALSALLALATAQSLDLGGLDSTIAGGLSSFAGAITPLTTTSFASEPTDTDTTTDTSSAGPSTPLVPITSAPAVSSPPLAASGAFTGLQSATPQFPALGSALSDYSARKTFALSQDLAALTTESGYSAAASANPTLSAFVSEAEEALKPFSGSIQTISGSVIAVKPTGSAASTATGTASTAGASTQPHQSGAGEVKAGGGVLMAVVALVVIAQAL